jgi:hypothetical protein
VAQPELAQPRDEPVHPPALDGQFGQGASEHDRNPVRGVARELGLEVGRREGGSPAELDDVHRVAGNLHQAVDLRDRESAVEDVRESVLARLAAALRKVEEGGHSLTGAAGLSYWVRSAPTVTTTDASCPATTCVSGSRGAMASRPTPMVRATASASARNPGA